ncbi:uncharacterized protein LOC135849124 [Planococcus citri]|uniref:uncharacterized protein LOC135849124 n=1 Tax=Planococcus citri TaxID=170843 RepID=UPI0031FA1D47
MIAIADLKTGLTGWTIKAVAQKKSKISEYESGKYFSCYFHDGTDEIKAIAFNDNVNQFFNKIENDKCYTISGALIKVNTYRNVTSMELRLNKTTELTVCDEDDEDFIVIPKKTNYVKIEECNDKTGEVSIIGVLSNIMKKTVAVGNSQKEIAEATIMDETGEIMVTFWEPEHVNSNDFTLNSVFAIEDMFLKQLKSGSKRLNVNATSKIKKNPAWDRTEELNNWLKNKCDSDLRINFSQVMDNSFEVASPKKTKRELDELLNDAEEELKKIEQKEMQLGRKKIRLMMEIETLKSSM